MNEKHGAEINADDIQMLFQSAVQKLMDVLEAVVTAAHAAFDVLRRAVRQFHASCWALYRWRGKLVYGKNEAGMRRWICEQVAIARFRRWILSRL